MPVQSQRRARDKSMPSRSALRAGPRVNSPTDLHKTATTSSMPHAIIGKRWKPHKKVNTSLVSACAALTETERPSTSLDSLLMISGFECAPPLLFHAHLTC